MGPLLGALGVSGLIIGFALQNLVANLVGGLVLEAGRPFRVGDQIDTNGREGTVIDINARSVVLLTYDGTHVHVPNSSVLSEPIENFTREPICRTQLPVQLPYDCDLTVGARVMGRTLRSVPDVEDSPPPDAIATSFDDSGITFLLRFWHASEEITTRLVVSEVITSVHRDLRAEGIEIPFPQRVVHLPDATPLDDSDFPSKNQGSPRRLSEPDKPKSGPGQ